LKSYLKVIAHARAEANVAAAQAHLAVGQLRAAVTTEQRAQQRQWQQWRGSVQHKASGLALRPECCELKGLPICTTLCKVQQFLQSHQTIIGNTMVGTTARTFSSCSMRSACPVRRSCSSALVAALVTLTNSTLRNCDTCHSGDHRERGRESSGRDMIRQRRRRAPAAHWRLEP
jgi:hypothetical protein